MDKSKVHFIVVAGFSSDDLEAVKFKKCLEEMGFSSEAVSFYGKGYRDDFSGITASECIENISKLINESVEKHDSVFGIGISLGGSLLLDHAKNHSNLKGIVGIGVPFKLRKIKLIHFGQKFFPIILPVWNHLQKIKKFRLSPLGAVNMTSSTKKKIIFFDNGGHVVNQDFNSIINYSLDFFDIH